MSWNTSSRRQELPANWAELRRETLQDACGICEWPGCTSPANQVDHIRRGNDHSSNNRQALCEKHHIAKSSREGHARQRELRARKKRPTERHPGQR
jgi:5-methylcytosine-specific restriction endonuclease McrA